MKVNGIGGVFVNSDDPKSLAGWYSRHLGLEFNSDDLPNGFFQVFKYRDAEDPSRRLDTTFAILPAEERPGAGHGRVMINFRVDDLAALVAQLAADGIAVAEIQTQRDEEGFGKFAHLVDPEGNPIELYEPIR